jgi:hypothetical protein
MVDGREQSELSDVCDVNRTSRTRWLGEDKSATSVSGECIPYWSEQISHRRTITLLANDEVRIRDQITGSGEHRLEWTFQFAPELAVTADRNHLVKARAGSGQTVLLSLRAVSGRTLGLELFHGCRNPLRGWVSRDSATVLPATCAVFTIEAELPFQIDFVINTCLQADSSS